MERWQNGIRRDWWPRCIVLFASLLAFSSADAQTVGQQYREPVRIVEVTRTTTDSVWYRVLHSEASPTTIGRTYGATLVGWKGARWVTLDSVPKPPTDTIKPEPVDTVKPVPADTAYPNRPAGLTLIARNDGTVKESGGHAFGFADFGNWYDHNIASDIAVVADPTNPTGSGQSLRFTYPSNDSKAGSATARSFTGGPYRELYVAMRVFMEPNGWTGFGNKFFYVGAAEGQRRNTSSPTQFYTDRPGGARLRVINQNGTNAEVVASNRPPPIGAQIDPLVTGRWLVLEFYFVAESAPGAGDGRAYQYVNGTAVGSNTAVRWNTNGFSGMEWYGEVNRIPTTSYYRLGELYIAGR